MASQEFGTQFFDEITCSEFDGSTWSAVSFQASDALVLHPASHALHYASECFEGLKAFRTSTGRICVFRLDDHISRMQNSARQLCLPVPDAAQMRQMILVLLNKYADQVPDFPGTAYIRPTLIGTDRSIGRAASPSRTALLYILISPVGDYISADAKVSVLLDTDNLRCAPHFGAVKSGGNYASALGLVMQAREKYGVEQVIFAPNGDVQETAATNCLLINDTEVITKPLSNDFLPGITRDSLLKVAAHLGYQVTERNIDADELIDWAKTGEVALSGTAAVLVPVSEVVYHENRYSVNAGNPSVNTMKLRQYLNALQQEQAPDSFGWLTPIA
ncbi:branched-chain-amino-acid transaminase [Ostreibacterium oceani]|uniref:Branched-chain-amino-acid transaminase n=1 Tax=Ostreibacterium oceani TaxID=2654998 RepID=A0A6N7EW03_9GAMM|nr:branched-chain-amino-acid transaminase [Ostreibacterium oceani]MPV85267.1 branched-chain-amino-acid transaminase [Ostreibacterium oceani]